MDCRNTNIFTFRNDCIFMKGLTVNQKTSFIQIFFLPNSSQQKYGPLSQGYGRRYMLNNLSCQYYNIW